ncbi:MAG: hypothetical protein ABJE95_30110 [Byssovorax sp.]
MKHPSSAQALLIFVFALVSPALTGCGAGATSGEPAVARPAEVSRESAVNTARSDAATHFLATSLASTEAHLTGPYWVVDLRTASGVGLRYAISRQDGSIRQRGNVQ